MNAYPVDLVVELQPCVHASGLLPNDSAPPGLVHPAARHPALCKMLAEALAPRSKAALWTSAGAGQRVCATLVHRDHTLPPARMRAGQRLPEEGARSTLAALPPRSPLSPLFPGGPLFPDGLITPSWIRKHGEYIPAVRLAFFCMPPDDSDTMAKDAALIEAITTLRASLAPRGTRLVAVLLCEPLLYAQGVDARVAHVRRAAGLETRGAVYALSTAAQANHAEFLHHIYTRVLALAHDAYHERARNVRRHRARCPPPPSVVQPVLQAAAQTQLLSPSQRVLSASGWNVRLFYKLGALAEWQGAYDEARAMYEDAYRELMDVYLRDTPARPPMRRSLEAQALADTLVLKLVRLHLYAQAPARARTRLEQHRAAIHAQCDAWALSSTTPERWAWQAKAYSLVAELVHEVQHPLGVHGMDEALLYYHASLCHLEAMSCGAPWDAAHGAAISCLSAAYDAFRVSQRARLAHWTAVRLALIYTPWKPAQARPFLERTLRWYRRDGWHVLRVYLALRARSAALACDDPAAAAHYVLELRQPVPPCLADEAQAALRSGHSDEATGASAPAQKLEDAEPGSTPTPALSLPSAPASPPPMDTSAAARLVRVRAIFARPRVVASESMAFQVAVHAVTGAHVDDLDVQSLTVYLAGHSAPLVQVHAGSTTRSVGVGRVQPGATAEAEADLTLDARASPLLVHGHFVHEVPGFVTFSHATLRVASALGPFDVSVPVDRDAPWEWYLATGQRVPLPPRADVRALLVTPPPVDVCMPTTLLCGEVARVTVKTSASAGTLVVTLPLEAEQAGAALCTDTSTHTHLEMALVNTPSFWVRAPPTPTVVRLSTHCTVEGAPVPRTQRDYTIRVLPAFTVRAQVQWPSYDRGSLHTDLQYVGDMPIELVRVRVDGSQGVQAQATLGLDDEPWVWAPQDTGTLITPLQRMHGAKLDAEKPTTDLRVTWRRVGASTVWPCEARWPLPSLAVPPFPTVRITLSSPAEGTVGAPLPVTVSAYNTSADRVAEARLQVERVDACWLAGTSKQALPMLLPHETRTLTWHLYPQRAGLCRLPVLRAWDDSEAQELPVHMALQAVYVRLP
ncbi:hypothetical protein MEQU1_001597 [Malassezia equina]|uniref:Trafficking protein particle complex subunit 11 domain-containing protein n=1 Tax=Malassezia equina TaxID=1381935 RepID=A0AAF0ECB6_9BASI|nr:hypothetical protein MEQU1_001597 [Malassezia equina]